MRPVRVSGRAVEEFKSTVQGVAYGVPAGAPGFLCWALDRGFLSTEECAWIADSRGSEIVSGLWGALQLATSRWAKALTEDTARWLARWGLSLPSAAPLAGMGWAAEGLWVSRQPFPGGMGGMPLITVSVGREWPEPVRDAAICAMQLLSLHAGGADADGLCVWGGLSDQMEYRADMVAFLRAHPLPSFEASEDVWWEFVERLCQVVPDWEELFLEGDLTWIKEFVAVRVAEACWYETLSAQGWFAWDLNLRDVLARALRACAERGYDDVPVRWARAVEAAMRRPEYKAANERLEEYMEDTGGEELRAAHELMRVWVPVSSSEGNGCFPADLETLWEEAFQNIMHYVGDGAFGVPAPEAGSRDMILRGWDEIDRTLRAWSRLESLWAFPVYDWKVEEENPCGR